MCFLQIKKNVACHILEIYDIPNKDLRYRCNDLKATTLKDYLLSIKQIIDCVWIPIHKPYKQVCYEIGHIKKVIVPKEEVFLFLSHVMGQDYIGYMEEVAVGLQGTDLQDKSDIGCFFTMLYGAKSEEEARSIYHSWQEVIPLNEPLYYKVLTILEAYQDEIFNYFS